jgi:uncharacterized protein YggE
MFNNETVMGRRMNITLTVLAVVLIFFLIAQTINSFKFNHHGKGGLGYGDRSENTISVSGKGELFIVPDVATVSFSVVEQKNTVAEAQQAATAKIDATLAAVRALGVEDKDIKTLDYNAYPRYEYTQSICTQFSCPPSKQILTGYEVRQSILVKVRKIDDAGKVLAAVGTAGASDISGINFIVDDEDAKVREARKLAIDDAKAQAQVLANDLGVELGDIVSFSEGGNYPVPMYYASKDMAMGMGGAENSAPQLPVGENKITSNVTIVYEIK